MRVKPIATPGMSNADKLKLYRANAKAIGLCGVCRARPAKTGRLTCEHCLGLTKAKVYDNRLHGLCDCGNRPRRGLATCDRCSSRNERNKAKTATQRVASGLCPDCGARPPASERARCRQCLDIIADRASLYYGNPLTRPCSVCGETGHNSRRHG